MPRQTKDQKLSSLLNFVVDFTIVIEEKFKDSTSTIGMVRIPNFEKNGWWYCDVWREVWKDGFTEYRMVRSEKNIFDKTMCKTKKEQESVIHESAFIYPLHNVVEQSDGVVIGDWLVTHFSRKKGWW